MTRKCFQWVFSLLTYKKNHTLLSVYAHVHAYLHRHTHRDMHMSVVYCGNAHIFQVPSSVVLCLSFETELPLNLRLGILLASQLRDLPICTCDAPVFESQVLTATLDIYSGSKVLNSCPNAGITVCNKFLKIYFKKCFMDKHICTLTFKFLGTLDFLCSYCCNRMPETR